MATKAYQRFLQDLASAADTGSLSAGAKAFDKAVELSKWQLNAATFKKLVKDHKVGLLLGESFTTCARKNPCSGATFAASTVLLHFLRESRKHACHSLAPFSSNCSSSAAAGSLEAEVRTQLQQSGLLQQLPRTMTAVAQQLEAYAAHPDGAAAGWQAASQPGPFRPSMQVSAPPMLEVFQAHTQTLLDNCLFLTWLCDTDHAQKLAAAGLPAAAHISMLLLRAVSAVIQLHDPLSTAAWSSIRALLQCVDAVKQFHQVIASMVWTLEQSGQSVQGDTHVYQLNIAYAAANALKLQADCTKASPAGSSSSSGASSSSNSGAAGSSSSNSGAAGSSNSGAAGSSSSNSGAAGSSNSGAAGSSSSSRAAGSSSTDGGSGFGSGRRAAAAALSTQQRGMQQGERDTHTASQHAHTSGADAARAWQRAYELASSLTPMQQELYRQLGVDARVLLWGLEGDPQDRCIMKSVFCAGVHNMLFAARASAARRQSHQQGQEEQQPQQGQEEQQGQQGQQGQPDWPLDFCLNLLLQCAVLPGILPLLLAPSSKDHAYNPFSCLYNTLTTLRHLGLDVDAATQALCAAGPRTSLQGFPLQACLEELLHNLLLLPQPLQGQLAALTQQQQQAGPGATAVDSSSSGSSGSGSNAAGTHSAAPSEEAAASILLLGIIFSCFPEACVKAAGPAAAAAFAGAGTNSQQANQQQQEDSIAELLRPQCVEVFRHLDSCVRVIAAASTSTEGPSPMCADLILPTLEACSSLFGQQHSVQHLLRPAVQARLGSHEHWQLYSFLASMLKFAGSIGNSSSGGDAREWAELRARVRIVVGLAASTLVIRFSLAPASYEGSDTGAPAAAWVGSEPQASAAAAATQAMLPSLVLMGRAILQWAQEQSQPGGTLMPLGTLSAVYVCCNGFEPLPHDDPDDTNHLVDVLEPLQTCLAKESVSAALAAAGYQPHELQQQLELLLSTAATAAETQTEAEAVLAATLQQPWTEVLQPLVQQLQVVGTALSNLAVPNFCNNSSCSNVSGPTELQLVSGRSCMCGGCLTARYCSKACQRQHWRHHKPVCQAVAAAAAAAAPAAGSIGS